MGRTPPHNRTVGYHLQLLKLANLGLPNAVDHSQLHCCQLTDSFPATLKAQLCVYSI